LHQYRLCAIRNSNFISSEAQCDQFGSDSHQPVSLAGTVAY